MRRWSRGWESPALGFYYAYSVIPRPLSAYSVMTYNYSYRAIDFTDDRPYIDDVGGAALWQSKRTRSPKLQVTDWYNAQRV